MRSLFRTRSLDRDKGNDDARFERIRAVLRSVQQEYAKEAEGLGERIETERSTAAFLVGSEGTTYTPQTRHGDTISAAERNLVRGQERLREIHSIAERLKRLEEQLDADPRSA